MSDVLFDKSILNNADLVDTVTTNRPYGKVHRATFDLHPECGCRLYVTEIICKRQHVSEVTCQKCQALPPPIDHLMPPDFPKIIDSEDFSIAADWWEDHNNQAKADECRKLAEPTD